MCLLENTSTFETSIRMRKIFFYIFFVLLFIFVNSELLQIKEKFVQFERRIVFLEKKIDMIETGVCHEINMRTERPKMSLNRNQCVEFIDTVYSQYLKDQGEDGGLTSILTPTPENCPTLNQWCEIQRKLRHFYSK